jgi:hypothetical protein
MRPDRAHASANVPAPEPNATCDSKWCQATRHNDARGSVDPVRMTTAIAPITSATARVSRGTLRLDRFAGGTRDASSAVPAAQAIVTAATSHPAWVGS